MLARIRKATGESDQGFTLIELLVVIIIIGILAAIAIPVFLNQRKKGYDAQAKSDLHNTATALEAYFYDYNGYPASQNASAVLVPQGYRRSSNASDVFFMITNPSTANAAYTLSDYSDSGQQWCFKNNGTRTGVYRGIGISGSSTAPPTDTSGC